jgi:His/Glu/Gln/Arg/opine family amino acid ABC transporter permease subunit
MFDFRAGAEYLPELAHGAFISIGISAAAIVMAFVTGIVLSQIRLSRRAYLRVPVRVFVSVVRGTPFLIQLFIVYYGISALGLTMPAWLVGIIALALNSSAYQSEYFRAGTESIPRGYSEAGHALGMKPIQIFRRITMPLVLAKLMPPLTNEFILVLKNSAIVSVISVVELLRVGQQIIATTYRPTEIFIFVAAIYLIINLTIMLVVRLLGAKQSVWAGRNGGK